MENNEKFVAKIETYNIKNIIQSIYSIQNKLSKIYEESNYKEDDARKKIAYNLGSCFTNLELAFRLSGKIKELENSDQYSYEENCYFRDQFLDYNRDSIIMISFAYIEAYLRGIVCAKGIADKMNISKVFEDLMKYPELGMESEEENLWSIFSKIRNSFHNMGFYNYTDKPIEYKNDLYKFTKDSPIEYCSINHVLFFIEKIIDNIILKLNRNTEDIDFIPSKEINVSFIENK